MNNVIRIPVSDDDPTPVLIEADDDTELDTDSLLNSALARLGVAEGRIALLESRLSQLESRCHRQQEIPVPPQHWYQTPMPFVTEPVPYQPPSFEPEPFPLPNFPRVYCSTETSEFLPTAA